MPLKPPVPRGLGRHIDRLKPSGGGTAHQLGLGLGRALERCPACAAELGAGERACGVCGVFVCEACDGVTEARLGNGRRCRGCGAG